MIFRFEYLFLAIAFIVGIFASIGCNEEKDALLNPYAQRISQTPLADYSSFAPANAEVLFVQRPKRCVEHVAVNMFVNSMFATPNLPKDAKEIEWLIVGMSRETMQKINSSIARSAFEDIAADLAAASGKPRTTNRRPSLANHLNTEFSGLIQFVEPAGIEIFADMLNSKDESREQYRKKNWLGRETLQCEDKDSCVVARLDVRTFVVGNKEDLVRAFDEKRRENSPIAPWLQSLVENDFDGELFIGSDLSQGKDLWGGILPAAGVWNSVQNVQSWQMLVDTNTPTLVSCQMSFESQDQATQFNADIEKTIASESNKMEKYLVAMRELESKNFKDDESKNSWKSFPTWQSTQLLNFARSLQFSSKHKTVRMELPRPKQFDELVETYIVREEKYQAEKIAAYEQIRKSMEKRIESPIASQNQGSFDKVSRELDQITLGNAGRGSDAKQAFDDIARDLEAARNGSNPE